MAASSMHGPYGPVALVLACSDVPCHLSGFIVITLLCVYVRLRPNGGCHACDNFLATTSDS
jgi:hypothetical protein